MKVIFLKHVENVGKPGEVKDITDGYFRNFLLPRPLAKLATPQALKEAEAIKKRAEAEVAHELTHAQEMMEALKRETLVIAKKANEEGQLFGSVSAHDIAELCHQKGYKDVAEEHVRLEVPIKTIGDHQVAFRLKHGVEGVVSLHVEKTEA